jgi:hypothetical protein
MVRTRLALLALLASVPLALHLVACDAGAPDRTSSALRVAGAATLRLDEAGRPHMTALDETARIELPVTSDRADLLFRASQAADAPLRLTWRGGPRMVGLSSWAAEDGHDLRLDLRQAGAGPATLRVLDRGRIVTEAPVPTGVELPLGESEQEPTSIHVYIDEHGNKTIVFDYEDGEHGRTSLSSGALGLRRATATHLAVALPPGSDGPAAEVLAVEGAREITVLEADGH